MIGDDKEGIQPWLQVPEGPQRDLIFAYEVVLTEMRTHAAAGGIIAQWVNRIDFARDEFVRAMQTKISVPQGSANKIRADLGIEPLMGHDEHPDNVWSSACPACRNEGPLEAIGALMEQDCAPDDCAVDLAGLPHGWKVAAIGDGMPLAAPDRVLDVIFESLAWDVGPSSEKDSDG